MNTIVELLDALRTHLAGCALPAGLWSITVTAAPSQPQISVQLSSSDAPQVAAALLEWADTLTTPTAEAWRVPRGDSVHLSVTGQLPGDVSMRVYSGVPFSERGPGADLAPGSRASLPLGALRRLVELWEVQA